MQVLAGRDHGFEFDAFGCVHEARIAPAVSGGATIASGSIHCAIRFETPPMPNRELALPPLAHDTNAREVLRVWAVNGQSQECVLQPTWRDPAAWGLLLVDIARHAARAYALQGDQSEEQAMGRILAGLTAELSVPTDPGRQIRS